ncbi:MAG: pirin family protein [Cytophagales bacterium]|nr:pirin family protein [Cytophagales bacterium]
MKFLFRPDNDRWHKKDAWKTSAYAFVPNQTHFGELCGFADDVVLGGQGFGMHPHQNMEISTIVVSGIQAHRDNTGSEGLVHPLSVQTMSAGTGIMHSEFNASKTEPFHSYQIWVYPKVRDIQPRHETFEFHAHEKLNQVLLTISPDKRQGTAQINQDAFFSLSTIEAGKTLPYTMHMAGNGVYIHCVNGKATIEGYSLGPGDALGVYEADVVQIQAGETTELIFVEVPMGRGVKV